jgi:hypothetical protein
MRSVRILKHSPEWPGARLKDESSVRTRPPAWPASGRAESSAARNAESIRDCPCQMASRSHEHDSELVVAGLLTEPRAFRPEQSQCSACCRGTPFVTCGRSRCEVGRPAHNRRCAVVAEDAWLWRKTRGYGRSPDRGTRFDRNGLRAQRVTAGRL